MEQVEVTFEDDVAADLAAYAREKRLPTPGAAAERLLGDALERRRRARSFGRAGAEDRSGRAADEARDGSRESDGRSVGDPGE